MTAPVPPETQLSSAEFDRTGKNTAVLARVVAASLAIVVLAIVIFFIGVVVLRDEDGGTGRLQTGSGDPVSGARRAVGQTALWRVEAGTRQLPFGSIEVELMVTDQTGRPAPDELDIGLTLQMVGMEQSAIKLQPEGNGVFRTPQLELMQGRWRGRLTVPDGVVEFSFDNAG